VAVRELPVVLQAHLCETGNGLRDLLFGVAPAGELSA
jgi:hypothetical protein